MMQIGLPQAAVPGVAAAGNQKGPGRAGAVLFATLLLLFASAPTWASRGHHGEGHRGHAYGHRKHRIEYAEPRYRPMAPVPRVLPLPPPPLLPLPRPSLPTPPLPHLPGLPHP